VSTGDGYGHRLSRKRRVLRIDLAPSWLEAMAVKFSRPSSRSGSYTSLVGLILACSEAQREMNSHAVELIRLPWVAGYIARRFTCQNADTHPSTNRAQCRATSCWRPTRYHCAKPPVLCFRSLWLAAVPPPCHPWIGGVN